MVFLRHNFGALLFPEEELDPQTGKRLAWERQQ